MNKTMILMTSFLFLLSSVLSFAQLDRKWYLNYIDGVDNVKKGNFAQAKQYLEWAIAQKGKPKKSTRFYSNVRGSYIPYYYLGIVYYNTKDYRLAEYNFKKSMDFGEVMKLPEKNKLLAYLRDTKKKLSTGNVSSARDAELQKKYDLAYNFYVSGDYKKAKTTLAKIKNPEGPLSKLIRTLEEKIRQAEINQKKIRITARNADNAFLQHKWQDGLKFYRELSMLKPDYPGVGDKISTCIKYIDYEDKLKKARSLAQSDPSRAEEILNEIKSEVKDFPGLKEAYDYIAEQKKILDMKHRDQLVKSYISRGDKAFEAGKWYVAKKYFNNAIKLGISGHDMARIKNVLFEIEQKLQKENSIKKYLALGKKALQEGQKEEAKTQFERVIRLDPGNSDALTMLKLLQSASNQTHGNIYKKLLADGIKYFIKGEYSEAIANLKNYLSYSADKQYVAKFFLGAALLSKYYLDRYKDQALLKEAKRNFSSAKKSGVFKITRNIEYLVSPKILKIYNKI